jgi:predicted XRE-type DNA-binding protein
MGRTLDQILDQLPLERRSAIEARADELLMEIEGLRALRALAEQSQEQIADALGIKQPSVHKIERQTDLYLSTLRRFVEAAGGKLELRIELPGKGTIRLTGIGDLHA